MYIYVYMCIYIYIYIHIYIYIYIRFGGGAVKFRQTERVVFAKMRETRGGIARACERSRSPSPCSLNPPPFLLPESARRKSLTRAAPFGSRHARVLASAWEVSKGQPLKVNFENAV